jgi:hypothetical protein
LTAAGVCADRALPARAVRRVGVRAAGEGEGAVG